MLPPLRLLPLKVGWVGFVCWVLKARQRHAVLAPAESHADPPQPAVSRASVSCVVVAAAGDSLCRVVLRPCVSYSPAPRADVTWQDPPCADGQGAFARIETGPHPRAPVLSLRSAHVGSSLLGDCFEMRVLSGAELRDGRYVGSDPGEGEGVGDEEDESERE